MKNFLKGKIGTVAIIIATLILAGVAIFTAIRLYQLRQQAIAPTAPESKPEAAASKILKCEPITIKIPGTPGPSPTPIACNNDCGGPEDAVEGASCKTGLKCVAAGSKTVCRNPACPGKTNCICPTTTPTPAGCNKSCNVSVNPQITCEEGLVCRSSSGGITGASGFCRNPDCPGRADCICPIVTPTPTPTEGPGEPNDCGGTCGSNTNCKSNLFCFEGICRNPSCSAEEDCTCSGGGVTPTPTSKTIAGGGGTKTTAPTLEPTEPSEEIPAEPTAEPSLPEAGISFPTIIGTGVGILLLIGALLLAL